MNIDKQIEYIEKEIISLCESNDFDAIHEDLIILEAILKNLHRIKKNQADREKLNERLKDR